MEAQMSRPLKRPVGVSPFDFDVITDMPALRSRPPEPLPRAEAGAETPKPASRRAPAASDSNSRLRGGVAVDPI
jgi:hypothetical protein